MSFERVDISSLSFCCDECLGARDFTDGETFAECVKVLHADGWISLKTVGREWEHFCDTCAPLAQKRAQDKREAERERERIRARNAERTPRHV